MLQDSISSTPMIELLPSTTDIDSQTGTIMPAEVRDMELILPSLPIEENIENNTFIYVSIGVFIIILILVLKRYWNKN